ncbi:unnamed protein product [Oppiella nova]|uniref:Nuclear receptor domain-containing protein n=1 Tax=Oppiella nova TaxID=334625 RepID=A0A7R9LA21_9ACAR|nr:unnamed protein product [Oppiella nova]CAG2161447.1 unnamed protein product [Oppiella nova]
MKQFKRNAYKLCKRFMKNISREWDSDDVVLNLLTAIILYNPNRPDLIHRDSVKYQQLLYQYLLQRYLLLRYRSESEAQYKYTKLMNTLRDLKRLNIRELNADILYYNVLKEKFVCNFGNNCTIDVKTRRFCIKCRLDKCYAMGMNEAYMLTAEEKSYRKFNGIRNRKQKPKESDNTVDSTTQTKKKQKIWSLSYTSHTNTGDSTMDIENRFTIQTIVEKSGNLWLNSVIPMRRPLLDYRNQFNELEFNKLRELLTAKLDTKTIVMIGLDIMKQFKRNAYKLCKRFMKNISREWDSDDVVLNLLTAIILYNPNRPDLIHRDSVKYQQQLYRYRSESEAHYKYTKLMNTLRDLKVLSQIQRLNIRELNADILHYGVLKEYSTLLYNDKHF